MSATEDRQVLLWAAIEGTPGLWELEWELNSLHPDRADNRTLTRSLAQQLLEQQAIGIYRADSVEGQSVQLDEADALRVLARDDSWEPPPSLGEPVFRVSATKAGEAEYRHSS